MSLSKASVDISRFNAVFEKKLSLSTYFPQGTQFYYGYPAGENSGFLNSDVSPETGELFAARAYSCAGPTISVISYESTQAPCIPLEVFEELSIPYLKQNQSICLPVNVSSNRDGEMRNELIKKALKKLAKPSALVMAQPFTDKNMTDIFQISPHLTAWLNDKNNMKDYILESLLPKRYATYANGLEFEKELSKLELPVVIKASSSAGGDGVFICRTKADLEHATTKLGSLSGTILAEQYINDKKNYAIHFGVPADERLPIDILGVNEQLINPHGEFVGGIIRSTEIPEELMPAARYLHEVILPHVRSMGWHGIGGFDVLIDQKGSAYFIDCNFRMTGMSAYHFMIANNDVNEPLVAINGEFTGSYKEFEKNLFPYASKTSKDKFLQIIAMTKHADTWRFNASISFNSEAQLLKRARKLLQSGIKSHALQILLAP